MSLPMTYHPFVIRLYKWVGH